jgi:hypothetical protein
VGDHPDRGPVKSYEGSVERVPANEPTRREVRIDHVSGTQQDFSIRIIEGPLNRASC